MSNLQEVSTKCPCGENHTLVLSYYTRYPNQERHGIKVHYYPEDEFQPVTLVYECPKTHEPIEFPYSRPPYTSIYVKEVR